MSNNKETARRFFQVRHSRDSDNEKQIQLQIKEDRKKVIANNGCCLTCKSITVARGVFLYCSLKNKNVRQYNYCEKWSEK